jgi:hypothetical protein
MGFEATCDPLSLTRNCEPGIVATCQERHRRSGPWEKKRREGKGREKGSIARGQRAKDSLRCQRPPLLCSGALNPNFKSHKVRSSRTVAAAAALIKIIIIIIINLYPRFSKIINGRDFYFFIAG